MNATELNELSEVAKWLNTYPRNYYRGVQLLRAYHPRHLIAQSLAKYKNEERLNTEMLKRYRELRAIKAQAEPPAPKPKTKKELTREIDDLEARIDDAESTIDSHEDTIDTLEKTVAEITTKVDNVAKQVEKEKPTSYVLRTEQKLREDVKQLFKDRGRWHTEMSLVGENKIRLSTAEKVKRFELARLIVKADRSIAAIYMELNYFELHGRFPLAKREPKPKPLTDAESLKRLNNSVMPNISKLKAKIKKAQEELPKLTVKKYKDKAMAKLATWQENLKILETEREELRKKLHEQTG